MNRVTVIVLRKKVRKVAINRMGMWFTHTVKLSEKQVRRLSLGVGGCSIRNQETGDRRQESHPTPPLFLLGG